VGACATCEAERFDAGRFADRALLISRRGEPDGPDL
jgi:hypothetical protein